jgi:serine/threonine-protein kinase
VSSKPRGLIGTTLGRYEIREELGHGGMATVYRAHDPRLERDVALKVIHHHLRDNAEIATRFKHEAKAVAKLKHRSIVEIYDVPDAEDGERFLVAEFVDGPSLRKYLQTAQKERRSDRAPVMPPEIAAAIILQVLSALSAAHAEGIIHRDVKPENILVAGLGAPTSLRPSDPARSAPVAKLTDFGIAKILDAVGMTSTGQILGSPAHMAPEQIEGGDVTTRVDVFATGVLFYELLTGCLPFDGKNPAQVIRRVLDGNFTPAERVTPQVGGRWSALVGAMLARDPEKRPGSTEEVAASIERELEAMGMSDANRELVEYLRDPTGIHDRWGERVKPILLARANRARDAGDVVGAAHDLNRALAYDPSDPRLVRAVGSIRARERRARTIRRAAPLVLGGAVVVFGTFFGVRWLQKRDPKPPPPATAIQSAPETTPSPKATTSAPIPPASTTTAAVIQDAAPSITSTTSVATVPTATTSATDSGTVAVHGTRKVHVNIFPPGTFMVDNEGPYDPLKQNDLDLTLGDHTFTGTGHGGCCGEWKQTINVTAGETPYFVDMRLPLNPARIFINGAPEAGVVTVTVSADGAVIASGEAPLAVPMTKTSLSVTIKLSGAASGTVDRTLKPGDAVYVDPS